MSLADTIKKQRKAHGLTQGDLAQLSGVPQSRLSEYENGTRTPTPEALGQIGRVIGPLLPENHLVLLEGIFSDACGWIKALGVLRLLQHVPLRQPRLGWLGAHACIEDLSVDQVLMLPSLFRPTPVFSPWNSGNADYGLQVAESLVKVFPTLIGDARRAVVSSRYPTKSEVVRHARNTASDEALDWIDACLWETREEELFFNGILGSGGNEGRLDYSRAYLRAVESLYVGKASEHRDFLWEVLLSGSSAAEKSLKGLPEESCGAFGTTKNPWEVIAFIEGAMVLGSSVAQRLGKDFRHPTNLNPTSGEGNRGELWLPIWDGTSTLPELKEWLSSFWVGGHPGTPVMAAVKASLGNAGARKFARAGILQRNGQSHMICRI